MKVLITAGPTWAKIDQVRILTNRFSGRTGLALARELNKAGHRVTLLINPHAAGEIKLPGVKVVDFHYFAEFKNKVCALLRARRYDVIIHSAAVSDYVPACIRPGKISSGKNSLNLKLVPAEKIIKTIRRRAPQAILIQFKLEATSKNLAQKAYQSLRQNNSDFVVANAASRLDQAAARLIIDKDQAIKRVSSLPGLARHLKQIIRRGGRRPPAKKTR